MLANIDNEIKEIIVKELGAEKAEVISDASFVSDLRANSFDMVELILAFEQTFEIEIPDSDAERIRTVQDAIDCIRWISARGRIEPFKGKGMERADIGTLFRAAWRTRGRDRRNRPVPEKLDS